MKKTTLAALAALAVYSGAANAVLPMLLMMPLMMGGMMHGPGGDAATVPAAPQSGCEHDHDAGAGAPASTGGPLPVRPGTAGGVADPGAASAPEFGLPSSGTH